MNHFGSLKICINERIIEVDVVEMLVMNSEGFFPWQRDRTVPSTCKCLQEVEVSGEWEWDVYFKLVPKCWSSVLLANFMQIIVDISIAHLCFRVRRTTAVMMVINGHCWKDHNSYNIKRVAPNSTIVWFANDTFQGSKRRKNYTGGYHGTVFSNKWIADMVNKGTGWNMGQLNAVNLLNSPI